MMKRFVPVFLLLLTVLLGSAMRNLSVERIMFSMKSQSLHRGQVAEVEADLFFQAWDGRLVTKYTRPVQEVMITNNKGELAIYNQQDNTLYRSQSLEYSSENNLIYFFLAGMTQDLGLRQMDFELMETRFEDGLMITEWFPPPSLYHLFSRIELVHEDYLPIYAGYYDAGQKLVKKVYYTNYEEFPEIVLPMNITEFNYTGGGDSIVNRVEFSDVRINQRANSPWFNFEIPEDAEIID